MSSSVAHMSSSVATSGSDVGQSPHKLYFGIVTASAFAILASVASARSSDSSICRSNLRAAFLAVW